MTSLGQQGKVLADLQTGCTRRDRPKLATDFLRCIGFHVKAFVLRQSAGKEDEDARLCFSHGGRANRGASFPQGCQMVASQSKDSNSTNLQRLAAA
jgi:hypothetical protein